MLEASLPWPPFPWIPETVEKAFRDYETNCEKLASPRQDSSWRHFNDGSSGENSAGGPAAGNGHAGCAERHHDARWETAATTANEIRRSDQGRCQGFHALVAAANRATQRCPQCPSHHDRRQRLWRLGNFWRRHPHPGTGPRRYGGLALYPVSFHGTLLTDARCAYHWPQSSFGWVRRHRGIVHRLPRL